MDKKTPKVFPRYLILKMMDERSTYGYEILKKVQDISGGHWEPSYGTIYGTLERMENKGYIEQVENDHEDRNYFTLTEKGREKLSEIQERVPRMGEKYKEVILGGLNIYRHFFGDEKTIEILEEVKEEMEK